MSKAKAHLFSYSIAVLVISVISFESYRYYCCLLILEVVIPRAGAATLPTAEHPYSAGAAVFRGCVFGQSVKIHPHAPADGVVLHLKRIYQVSELSLCSHVSLIDFLDYPLLTFLTKLLSQSLLGTIKMLIGITQKWYWFEFSILKS